MCGGPGDIWFHVYNIGGVLISNWDEMDEYYLMTKVEPPTDFLARFDGIYSSQFDVFMKVEVPERTEEIFLQDRETKEWYGIKLDTDPLTTAGFESYLTLNRKGFSDLNSMEVAAFCDPVCSYTCDTCKAKGNCIIEDWNEENREEDEEGAYFE